MGVSWNCRAVEACSDSQMANVKVCSATDACKNLDMASNAGDLFCSGETSCEGATLSEVGAVHCTGLRSCLGVQLQTMNALYCDATSACEELNGRVRGTVHIGGSQGMAKADIQSDGDLEIFAYGSNALSESTIECVSGSVCTLYCYNAACDGLESFACDAGAECNVECEGSEVCPTVSDNSKLNVLAAVAVQLSEVQSALMDEPMVVLVGAGSVLLLLGAAFYMYGGKDKEAYEEL